MLHIDEETASEDAYVSAAMFRYYRWTYWVILMPPEEVYHIGVELLSMSSESGNE